MTHPDFIRETARQMRVEKQMTIDDISLCSRWMERFATNPFTYSVQHYEDQDPGRLRKFWSSRLGVSPTSITFSRKTNSGQLRGRQWRCRYGVVQVRASDTQLRARLQSWIDATRTDWTTG